ncbi:unnamed protein product [Soboliphyme baturini]|uniref:Uncharacterized protein n=1 Tax=Soboliphyme baturini TaxID=241478 RepID=A0A183IUL1_9BILA|nr:unnamed protein product [Soboliphyme baturini]
MHKGNKMQSRRCGHDKKRTVIISTGINHLCDGKNNARLEEEAKDAEDNDGWYRAGADEHITTELSLVALQPQACCARRLPPDVAELAAAATD